MKLHYYTADGGNLKLMHKSGAEILLRNFYGDGTFKYYIFNTRKEMIKHINGRYEVETTELIINQNGWKIMDYDYSKSYNNPGTILKSKFITIYRVDQCFMFVLNMEE